MTKVRFDQIAKEVRNTFSGDKAGVPIVGLEHIIPNELLLSDHDIDTENTFTKAFKKGQILFGRRRAYQQKAAVATFDGICSGDITVIEPIDGAVCPELLPFIIQNERFFEHAVRGSAGSLSPRVKWEHLSSYEIELPSYEEQVKLANTLWAAYNLKTSYKTLLTSIDEMVKSQFIEMFGEQSACNRDPLQGNVNEMFIWPFGSSLKNDCFVEKEDGYCVVYEQKHAIDKDITVPFRYVTERKYNELKRFTILPNDIIVSCRGTVGQVFMIPENAPMGIMHPSIMKIRLKVESYLPEFFVFALTNYMKNREIQNVGTGIKMAVTATTLAKEKFAKPSISEQQHFVDIVHQADKSKQIAFSRAS